MPRQGKRGPRIPHSIVNVELIANRDFIEDMLLKGHSVCYIHDLLKKDKKITIGYHSLLHFCNKHFELNFPRPKPKKGKVQGDENKQ